LSQESLAMGYERMILMTFLICAFSLGSMAMIGRGQAFNDPTSFWLGIAMLFGGVFGLIGYAMWKFVFEFNSGYLLYNIMFGGSNKPIQETIYFEEIEEITSPTLKEDLSQFIKPGEEYLLPMMNSPNFYYTRLTHRGDRPGNGDWAETDFITVLPFTTAVQFFGFHGSFICEYYPRWSPKLSIAYGEYRGVRETVSTLKLTRLQLLFQKLHLKDYDTRVIKSVPIYFILGSTITARYSNLIQKLPHLEADWVETQARGVQSMDAADRDTEIDMLYNIIENDKRLLSRKLRPAFYETPMIERGGMRGKIDSMNEKTKLILAFGALIFFVGLWLWSSGRLML
jgi:hypothetical protein